MRWAKKGPLLWIISKLRLIIDFGYSEISTKFKRICFKSFFIWLSSSGDWFWGKVLISISRSQSNFEVDFLECNGPKLWIIRKMANVERLEHWTYYLIFRGLIKTSAVWISFKNWENRLILIKKMLFRQNKKETERTMFLKWTFGFSLFFGKEVWEKFKSWICWNLGYFHFLRILFLISKSFSVFFFFLIPLINIFLFLI